MRPVLAPTVSAYFDVLRLGAAATVAMGHLSFRALTGGVGWPAAAWMNNAVVLFFVLSGYFIAMATEREATAGDYAVARLSRLWSVALPMLLLTAALDAVGRPLAPNIYESIGAGPSPMPAWQALVHGLFLGEVWWARVPAGSDLPYWSLGFEAPYYVLFGLYRFVNGRIRWVILAAVAVAYGPQILAMWPVWLAGVAAYRAHVWLSPRDGLRVALGSAVAGLGLAVAEHHTVLFPLVPWLPRRLDVLQDWSLAPLIAVHLAGITAAGRLLPSIPHPVAMAVRWLAGATFTLYLAHLPVATFWAATGAPVWLVIAGTGACVLLLAEVTERRKLAWRRAIRGVAGWFGGPTRMWLGPIWAGSTPVGNFADGAVEGDGGATTLVKS